VTTNRQKSGLTRKPDNNGTYQNINGTDKENKGTGSWKFEALSQRVLAGGRMQRFETSRVRIEPKIRIAEVRKWIDQCDTGREHPELSAPARRRLAKALPDGELRVINAISGVLGPLPENATFTALSYVWDPSQTSASPHHECPAIVKDALELTRGIGIDWLWVDRLCIDQDNEDEKFALVPVIKDIFALAELTLVAATDDGAHSPLPSVSAPRLVSDEIREVTYSTHRLRLLPSPPILNRMLEPCAWRRRGWTFEEHVFSRRLLYLFPSEAIFSCAKGSFREAYGMQFQPGSAGSTWGDGGARPPAIESQLHAKFNTATDVGN
jgi:hypothetical protein